METWDDVRKMLKNLDGVTEDNGILVYKRIIDGQPSVTYYMQMEVNDKIWLSILSPLHGLDSHKIDEVFAFINHFPCGGLIKTPGDNCYYLRQSILISTLTSTELAEVTMMLSLASNFIKMKLIDE
jgi:hypothetical protein